MTGIIVRMDKSGLGIQTLRLARMLKPDKLMIINSKPFNDNEQHPEWYKNYESVTIRGFPSDLEIRHFLTGLDKVISCELFYSNRFTSIARDMRVKTILIANPEFFDWFKGQWAFIPLPNKVIVPSKWMLKEMKQRFNAEYLPTPIFNDEFEVVRHDNLKHERRRRRFIHIVGKLAAKDRNGTLLLLEALAHSKADYELVIRSQGELPPEYKTADPRVTYDSRNLDDQQDMYRDADALILPRRYGGQAISCTEALYCGLPVIMGDIDPNNKLLPKEWLVDSYHSDYLMTRTRLELFSTYPEQLAEKIDWLVRLSDSELKKEKVKAVDLADKEFAADVLLPKYLKLIED